MGARPRVICGIALVLAAVVIASGLFVTRQTNREVENRFRQFKAKLKADKAAGKLSPEMSDADIDDLQFGNVGMPMSGSLKWYFDLTRWIEDFWFLLIPLLLALCFVGALLLDRLVQAVRPQPSA